MSPDLAQVTLVQAMKNGMRRLVSGVSVVTARDGNGRGYAMTVSSVTSVSDEPPSLLVCINKNTQIAPVLQLGQSMAINVLSQKHQDISILCSTGEQNEARLKSAHWDVESGDSPFLKDAEVVFECVVDQVMPYGTHNIVVAKIVSVQVSKQDVDALVYANGVYQKVLPV